MKYLQSLSHCMDCVESLKRTLLITAIYSENPEVRTWKAHFRDSTESDIGVETAPHRNYVVFRPGRRPQFMKAVCSSTNSQQIEQNRNARRG